MANLSPWYMQYDLAELKGDPEALARSERRTERFRLAREGRRQKIRGSLKEGLSKFDVGELEAWQDTEGYDEITGNLEELRQRFTVLQTRGYDLSQPRTKEEFRLSKKMNDAFVQVQKKADLYKLNKALFSDLRNKLESQKLLEEHERTIDVEATEKKLMEMLEAPTIGKMNELLTKGAYISKAKPIDLQENYSTMLDQVMTGQESWKESKTDPETGKIIEKSVAGTSNKSLKAANKKLIKTMPERVLKQYKADYEADLYKEGKSFEDWMMRYSPVSLKKVSIEEEKVKVVGTEPPKDEKGDVIWTEPTKAYYSVLHKENVDYKSKASIDFANVFKKSILIPILPETINVKTGESEGAQGEEQPTEVIRLDFYPVAEEEIKSFRTPGPRGAGRTRTVPKGEKIPVATMEFIERENKAAGRSLYKIRQEPFVDLRIVFTKIPILSEDGEKKGEEELKYIKTFGRSSIIPYNKLKEFLTGKEGFAPYDEAIRKMDKELNPSDDFKELFY